MKVALVAPPWEIMKNSYPPLGLGYVAAALVGKGHEVKIFDYGLDPEAQVPDMVEEVLDWGPQMIGITTWTHLYDVCCALSEEFKGRRPEVPIVMGGPHVTIFPQETLEEVPSVDFTIFGEGEDTIVELARAFENQGDYESITGLAWRNGKKVVKNPMRGINRDLDRYPFPDRDLLEIDKYPLRADNGERMTTMITSRGCPYGCTYCFKGLFGRRYLMTSIDRVLEEIRLIQQKYDIHNIYFVDDLFVVKRDRLRQFCEELKRQNVKIKWQCLVRVDRLDEDDYRKMAEAGCYEVHYGIETADPLIMEMVDKQTTPDQVRKAVTWAHNAAIRTKGYFMVGLPGDTEETIHETIEFAASLPLDLAMFSLTTPFPGTKLWTEIQDRFEGMDRRDLFKRASYYYGSREVAEPMFNLTELPSERLIELVDAAYETFYVKNTRRRQLEYQFGKVFGRVLWMLWKSKLLRSIKPVKALGHKFLTRRDVESEHAFIPLPH